jgi:hypothetical protein
MNNNNWASDIATFSSGLFPFFQYCGCQVKEEFLELIITHYLPLGNQLIPCLPALVTAILPGLDEQDEKVQKSVEHLLCGLCDAVGTKFFFSAMWISI